MTFPILENRRNITFQYIPASFQVFLFFGNIIFRPVKHRQNIVHIPRSLAKEIYQILRVMYCVFICLIYLRGIYENKL